jgi:hypothetical protein
MRPLVFVELAYQVPGIRQKVNAIRRLQVMHNNEHHLSISSPVSLGSPCHSEDMLC